MDIPEKLMSRDYTLIIDRSSSMNEADQKGGKTRWEAIGEVTKGLAEYCSKIDPDGVTIYVFAGKFKPFYNVTSGSKVKQIFQEFPPALGGTNLDGVLKEVLDNYFKRKAEGSTKLNGEIILVITDGEPDDQKLAIEVIVEAANKIEKDSELGIYFIQIGSDTGASRFLETLDNKLDEYGAKCDICYTIHFDDLEDIDDPGEFLRRAIDE